MQTCQQFLILKLIGMLAAETFMSVHPKSLWLCYRCILKDVIIIKAFLWKEAENKIAF